MIIPIKLHDSKGYLEKYCAAGNTVHRLIIHNNIILLNIHENVISVAL